MKKRVLDHVKKALCAVLVILMSCFLIAAVYPADSSALYLFSKNGLYGYMDNKGNVVISPRYSSARQFSEGLAAVVKDGEEHLRFINIKGRVAISANKYYLGGLRNVRFNEGLAVVDTEDNPLTDFVLIDTKGGAVAEQFPTGTVNDFNECYAAYSNLKPYFAPMPGYEYEIKASYLKPNGEFATHQTFTITNDFSNGIAAVGKWIKDYNDINGGTVRWALIDKDFRVLTDYCFDYAGAYQDGLIPVCVNSKWGYVNCNGDQIIDYQYDNIPAGSVSYQAGNFDRISYFDRGSKGSHDFSQGLAVVCKDGKCGYIDTSGKIVIPLQYENAQTFSEGLAAVQKNGKWGFINQTGKLIIPHRYDKVLNCQEGLIAVADQKGHFKYYIDKSGRVIHLKTSQ